MVDEVKQVIKEVKKNGDNEDIKKKIIDLINNGDYDGAIKVLKCCKKIKNNDEGEKENKINCDYLYTNTKEDYCKLKSAYIGNELFEDDNLVRVLMRVKIIDILLNKKG